MSNGPKAGHRQFAASALGYVALTVAMGWPVLRSLSSEIVANAGDPALNAAILAWNATTVPWTDHWYQLPMFAPTPDVLTFSENLLGLSVISTPLYWITGDALVTYNLTLLLTYPLCGLAMYLLVHRLTRSAPAAFLAGLAFAFMPYRVAHLAHLQLLAYFWAPLSLLGLHAFLDTRRYRWLALFGVCWVLQGLASSYLLVCFSLFVALWVLWFVVARRRWRELGAIAAAAGLAALSLAPILYRYVVVHARHDFSRGIAEVAFFSADIAAPLCAHSLSTFWHWLQVHCTQEGELFAGATLVALCVAGAWVCRQHGSSTAAPPISDPPVVRVLRGVALLAALAAAVSTVSVMVGPPWSLDLGFLQVSASSPVKPFSVACASLLIAGVLTPWFRSLVTRGSVAGFYLTAALLCVVLSWGPFPTFMGEVVLDQAPYAWLRSFPGADALRVPARFWLVSALGLVVVMGIMWAEMMARRPHWSRTSIVVLAACGLLMDGWTVAQTAPLPASAPNPEVVQGGTVVVLPFGDVLRDADALFEAVAGGWRTVNGHSGHAPKYYEELMQLSRFEDDVLLDSLLAVHGDIHVVVHRDAPRLLEMLMKWPEAELVASSVAAVQFRASGPTAGRPTAMLGFRHQIRTLTASCAPNTLEHVTDDNRSTRWQCGPQWEDQELMVDLGRSVRTGAILNDLGEYPRNYPARLVVDTSHDGVSWDTAWVGTGLTAAMQHPGSVRLVFSFQPRAARYIRLRQVGRDERRDWSVAELEVRSGDAPQ